MTERKFKVGDVVNALDSKDYNNAEDWQGVTITSIEDYETEWPYTVIGSKRYPGEEGAFAEHELELAE